MHHIHHILPENNTHKINDDLIQSACKGAETCFSDWLQFPYHPNWTISNRPTYCDYGQHFIRVNTTSQAHKKKNNIKQAGAELCQA